MILVYSHVFGACCVACKCIARPIPQIFSQKLNVQNGMYKIYLAMGMKLIGLQQMAMCQGHNGYWHKA